MEKRQIIETFGGNVLDVWHLRNEARFLTGRGVYTITNEMKWPGVKLTTDQLQIDVAFRNGMSQRLNVSWVNLPLYRNRRPLLVCPNPQCQGRRYERLYKAYGGYFCRRCCGLTYGCKVISDRRRWKDRLEAIYLVFGHAQPPSEIRRPKGMYRRVFARYRREAESLVRRLNEKRRLVQVVRWIAKSASRVSTDAAH